MYVVSWGKDVDKQCDTSNKAHTSTFKDAQSVSKQFYIEEEIEVNWKSLFKRSLYWKRWRILNFVFLFILSLTKIIKSNIINHLQKWLIFFRNKIIIRRELEKLLLIFIQQNWIENFKLKEMKRSVSCTNLFHVNMLFQSLLFS